jgi:PHD/YefM family antitoxin component YafN of YafNO toxin-antitoxin module
MIIKSFTALKNDYGKISKLAHETDEPIYITKNDAGDIVVMIIEAFEKGEQILKLRSKIMTTELSRIAGEQTINLSEMRKAIDEKFDAALL